jgi:hypothetical protein
VAQLRQYSCNRISAIRKEVFDNLEDLYLTVGPDEGTYFHFPELPVGTLVKGPERARRIARLLDGNSFLFRDVYMKHTPSGSVKPVKKGRYLHPGVLKTIYSQFIQGKGKAYNEVSMLPYAGPTHHEDEDHDDEVDPASPPDHRHLQGPNAGKCLLDEIPRSVLGLVAVTIRFVLRQHDCWGERLVDIPDMSINDDFALEVDWLIRRTMAGLSLAEITAAVKNQEDDDGRNKREVHENDDDIMSDID